MKHDSPHYQAVLSTLFSQTVKPARAYLYDADVDLTETATLNGIVHDRMTQIFRLHGAIEMEPTLLLPVTNLDDEQTKATFLDRHGEILSLPSNALTPFARLAARSNLRRIKRYHMGDVYKPMCVDLSLVVCGDINYKASTRVTPGHPKTMKAAVFDIITPDVTNGSIAAAAEALAILDSCLDTFAGLNSYEIYISHSKGTFGIQS